MVILRYSPLILGATIVALAWAFSNNETKKEAETPVISKCDSLQLINNSMKFEIEMMHSTISKYKIGLDYLKEKDKRAYDFVINAGNLKFEQDSQWMY